MDQTAVRETLLRWIESNKEEYCDIARHLWSHPELGMEEYEASAMIADVLERNGFLVERGVADMPTAFIATFGGKGPVIGLNAEYDCLPGLSQKSTSAFRDPVIEGAPGQGCGHNILGMAEVLAAVALRHALSAYNIEATIKVFGSPAEELCIGKPFMARAGCYDDVDCFLDWHPMDQNRAQFDFCSAYFNIKYHFKGKTAHGNAPWHGRSALDAAVLAAHALELLREHYKPAPPECANTMNYTFSDTGPEFPNVVPDRATLWCIGRFQTGEEMLEIIRRVDKCMEAGALATETTVEKEFITASRDKIPNETLTKVLYDTLVEFGPVKYTEEEQNFVKEIQKSAGIRVVGLDGTIQEFCGCGTPVTDISEYSWKAPLANFTLAVAPGEGWHNWRVTACVGGSIGMKAMVHAGRILAASALKVIGDPGIIKAAKTELENRIRNRAYIKLIPDGTKPPLAINRATMEKYRVK